jgi:hypothetical protein
MSMLVAFGQHVAFSEFGQQSTKTTASKGLSLNATSVHIVLASAVLKKVFNDLTTPKLKG